MSASFTIDGLKELRDALEALPEQFTQTELKPLIKASAEGLQAELKSSYRKREGVLADRVVIEARDPRGLALRVRSKAPHAHLYEYGTIRRFTRGTGAFRGTMPATPTLVPAAIRWRRRMLEQTKAALRRMRIPGFTGSAEVRES